MAVEDIGALVRVVTDAEGKIEVAPIVCTG